MQETSFHFCEMSYTYCCRSVSLGNRLWDGDLCAGSLIGSGIRMNPRQRTESRITREMLGCWTVTTNPSVDHLGSSGARMAYKIVPGYSLVAGSLHFTTSCNRTQMTTEKGISSSARKSLHQWTVTRRGNAVVQSSLVPASRGMHALILEGWGECYYSRTP